MGEKNDFVMVNNDDAWDLQSLGKRIKEVHLSGDDNALQNLHSELNNQPGLGGLLYRLRFGTTASALTIEMVKELCANRRALVKAYMDAKILDTEKRAAIAIKDLEERGKTHIETVALTGQAHLRDLEADLEARLKERGLQRTTNLATFTHEKIEELRFNMVKATEAFLESDDYQRKLAEKYEHNEVTYRRVIESLNKQSALFFDYINTLEEDFLNNLKNRLQSQL